MNTGRKWLPNRVRVTLTAPNGLTSDPLTKPLSILAPEERSKLLRAYPGTTAYVRVLPPGEPQRAACCIPPSSCRNSVDLRVSVRSVSLRPLAPELNTRGPS